jgi:hypothetical protein
VALWCVAVFALGDGSRCNLGERIEISEHALKSGSVRHAVAWTAGSRTGLQGESPPSAVTA